MQALKILLVQAETIWEKPEENRKNLERLIEKQEADLIVLPETFSTGFSMRPKVLAEPMNGVTTAWMKAAAQRHNAVVTGSVIIESSGRFYNRLLWVSPDGHIQYYDKRHLFGLMGETSEYSAGTERKIFTLHGWKICPQICYDLRFPVWCRNRNDYDLLLFVANWPASREHAWRTLLHARAIENQCYAVGVNRIGKDGNDLYFAGRSLVVDPLGTTLRELTESEGVSSVTLKGEELSAIRTRFPFLQDRDSFSIVTTLTGEQKQRC